MLFDMIAVGNRLLAIRKRLGLTQAEVAERAELSGRTYADIERGTVNMRMETFLRICRALQATPDEILIAEDNPHSTCQEELLDRINHCAPKERETALKLLSVYLQSLHSP